MTVDLITNKLMNEGGKFSMLLLEVVESAAFQSRRGDDQAPLPERRLAVPEIPPPELRKEPPPSPAASSGSAGNSGKREER